MNDVAERERALYRNVWDGVEQYGAFSPGEEHASLFMEMAKPEPGQIVLDAGCGNGKGTRALQQRGLDVVMLDLVNAVDSDIVSAAVFFEQPLWDRIPTHVDFAFCCDVMEHIPQEYAMLVVSRLLECANVGAFFSIALTPDVYGAWVGQSLHQNVQPFVWWRDRLQSLGDVAECRDFMNVGIFYVRRRDS